VSQATLFAATLALVDPLAAADVVHDRRTSLFLRIDGDDVGWGECPVASDEGLDATARDVRGDERFGEPERRGEQRERAHVALE